MWRARVRTGKARGGRARGRALVPLALVAAIWAAAALAPACGGGEDDAPPGTGGPPRPVMMGFSTLPRELNAESYGAAIAFAGKHGEVLLVQRTVPWEDFRPGAVVSDALAETTAAEIEAIEDTGDALFFAIDPTDGATGRDRLGALPADMAGRRFDDEEVRAAFASYAEYIARNYTPEYLALGVEMNLYYERNEGDFEEYKSLYNAVYARVKEISPETQVTVTFQYEDLQGILPREDAHFASWHLLRAFEPNIDFIGLSTYPSLVFAHPAQIPEEYYTQVTAFTRKPVAFTEMGYATAQDGGNEEQAAFVERALRDAEDLEMPFAIWFAIWDPAYARDTPYAAFQSIGLRRADDAEKPGWQVWERARARAYAGG